MIVVPSYRQKIERTIRDYSKSQLKKRRTEKTLKRQTAIVVPSYRRKIVRQTETTQRAS